MPEFMDQDRIYLDLDNDRIEWMYYNPDSVSGGQFVTNVFDRDLLEEALEGMVDAEDAFDYIGTNCRQYLADKGTDFYGEAWKRMETAEPFAIGCTLTTLDELRLAYRAKDLIDEYCIEEFGSPAHYEDLRAIGTLKYQQFDGLNTVLPIGVRKINAFRTLTTESLAVFMPFKVQEIMDKGGVYYGQNAISNNLILCNKANLLNQSAWLLGVPGSGKSFCAKGTMMPLMLNTNDEILICDPEGEYAPMVQALMGDECAIIRVAAGGKDRLNAMYMVDGYGENDPIIVKSQFIMSLIEQIDSKGIGPQQKSIIDRCTRAVYREAEQSGIVPTLSTLRDKLMQQPEPEAKQIALSMELFTTGSLDIFGQHSTVDLDKRVTVFDIHGLGAQLKPTGLLVITDTILNRVTLNWKRGKRTHVFIDEFHVVFENEFSASFFNSAWRQFRKRNAYPTAITQNVEYLLDSVQASTMLSNSEFVVMLNQAASDREKLAKLLNISNEQLSYITNADAGCGLIKYGSALVPFVNRFPKDTKLYQLMTTRPGEGKFSGQAV